MSSSGKQLRPYQFRPGQSGNPTGGKKPAGFVGRIQALAVLDKVMGEERNKEKLQKFLQKAFDKDPVGFFKDFVMPLLPKESKGLIESGGRTVEWRSLLTVGEEAGPAAAPAIDLEAGDEG